MPEILIQQTHLPVFLLFAMRGRSRWLSGQRSDSGFSTSGGMIRSFERQHRMPKDQRPSFPVVCSLFSPYQQQKPPSQKTCPPWGWMRAPFASYQGVPGEAAA